MTEAKPVNYTREAFLHPLNLGILFGATLTTFFFNDAGFIPTFILTSTFGLELIYLGTIPRLTRFRQFINRKKASEKEPIAASQEAFNILSANNKKRFLILKHLSIKIKNNFENLPYTTQGLLENIEKKIEGLLTNYINLLELNQRFEHYLIASNAERLKEQINDEEKELANIRSEKLIEGKKRRLSILAKRLQRLKSVDERLKIAETELETIEDAVKYIYEQSMTMSNPEEIGYQLDNLLMDVEETSHIIDDIDSPYNKDFTILDYFESEDSESEDSVNILSSDKIKTGKS